MINDNVKTSDQKVLGYFFAILAACMEATFCIQEKL